MRIYAESGFFPADKPIKDFTKTQLHDFLYKEPTKVKVQNINMTYEGLVPKIQKSMLTKDVDALQPHIRAFVDRAVTFQTCPDCGGTRLNEGARSSKIQGKSIADACAMQISDLAEWVRGIDAPSVGPILTTLQEILDSFVSIGLGYLSLDRASGTLSGGEAQRTKMIRHLGSSLTDVTYVFDEPTIGLHPHDIQRMNELLQQLRDKGNTVLVVEHKPETIAIADHVVDLGPGAGSHGGEVEFSGTVADLRKSKTLTGQHLDHRVSLKDSVRSANGSLSIKHASLHNLKDVSVEIPLGVLTVVTGVAGLGQELADLRLDAAGLRRHGRRPVGDPRVDPVEPGHLHGCRRPHPRRVREGERREAGDVQLELGRRLPELQRARGGVHRSRAAGQRRQPVRGMRGQAVQRGGAGLQAGWQGHLRSAVDADRGRGHVLRQRAGPRDPGPARGCRARLSHARTAALHVVRRRTPAHQAGDRDGGEVEHLRARRADHRVCTSPTSTTCWHCSTAWSTTATP